MISPNSLANLRPYKPGAAPKGGRRSRDIDKTLRLARKGCPKAMLYALQVVDDPEESTRYRLKAAEIILATGMPKNQETLAQITAGGGIDVLQLRFVRPGEPSTAADAISLPLQPTDRITFDPATDVEGNDTG